MKIFGAMYAYHLASSIDSSNQGISERKITKQGSKNLKFISNVLTKAGKTNQIQQLVNISEDWVDKLNSNTDYIETLNNTWAQNHNISSEGRSYTVTFRKLHTIKNGITPILINRNHPTPVYGEYELIDLYGWTSENNPKTVLYKLKTKILNSSSGMYEFFEQVLGYKIEKDTVGYYIVRNNHDYSGHYYVTYFLPATAILS